MVDAGLAGQGAEKPGRVEPRAGAEDAAARQAEAQRQLPRDDIAGIGDVMSTPSKPLSLIFCA